MKLLAKKEMRPEQELMDALRDAEHARHVAYTRYLCEAILDRWPNHGPTLIRYAVALIELALYEEAGAVLDRAEAVVPEDRRHLVLAQRGHRLEHMGDFVGSEKQHLAAHDLDPDDATYLIYAGSVAFRRGDIPRAEELGRKAISCSEGCLDEAYFNLGGCLLAQRRYVEARDCYLRSLEIDPEYSIAKKRLADVERVIATQGEQVMDANLPLATQSPSNATH
jgi:tetratricopeptide (TPR) repeat protein